MKRLEPSTQELEHLIEDGHALLAKGFGPGFNGPLQVAIALPRHHDTAAVTQVTRALARTPGIVSVAQARVSPGGTAAALTAYPTTSPQSSQTSSLVSRLRAEVIPPIEQSTATRVYVGGATASQVAFSSGHRNTIWVRVD